MRRPRINLENGFPTSHQPLRRHRNAIIQQRILSSANEQSTRKSASVFLEVCVVGRDGRILLLFKRHVWEEGVDEVFDDLVVENQGLGEVTAGGEAGCVVAAEMEEESGKLE